MALFDDILDRATRRLKMDPELRLEVRRELAAHLDDAAFEYRAAGDNEEQAVAHAAEALGDADALADQLWQANRNRVRLRYWLKWVGRVTLLPLLIVAVVALLLLPPMLSRVQMWGLDADRPASSSFTTAVSTWYENRLRSQLSNDQRLIVFGDPDAESEAVSQLAIYERFPDEPMYYANYVNTLMKHWPSDHRTGQENAAIIKGLLAAFDRGKTVEPDNGYYDLMKAVLLLQLSTEYVKDAGPTYKAPRYRGRTEQETADDYRVIDPARYPEGLTLFIRAVQHPYIRSYACEMEQHRQSQLPRPKRLADFIYRRAGGLSILLPYLSRERNAARIVADYAFDQAAAGHYDEAQQMLAGIHRLAGLRAHESKLIIELLIAYANTRLATTYEMLAAQAADRPQDAEASRAQLQEMSDFFNQLRDLPPGHDKEIAQRAGVIARQVLQVVPNYRIDFKLPREAELAAFDQGILGVGMVLLIGALLTWSGVVALVYGYRKWRGRGDEPLLLWIGWRKLLVILSGGIILPAAVYVVWAWILPNSSHRFGLNYAAELMITEWVLLAIVMVTVTTHLSLRAMRQRAKAVGLELPPRPTKATWWTFAAFTLPMAAIAVTYLLTWPLRGPWWGLSGILILPILYAPFLILLWPVAWVIWLLMAVKAISWRWRTVSIGMLFIVGLAALIVLAVWTVAPSHDRWSLAAAGVALSLMGMLVITILRLCAARTKQPRYAASVARSLVPIYSLGALLLVFVGSLTLSTLEAVRVRQLVDGDVFLWTEVERSDYRHLRDRLLERMPASDLLKPGRTSAGRATKPMVKRTATTPRHPDFSSRSQHSSKQGPGGTLTRTTDPDRA